ncbi:MAG: DUF2267 domain-containing protein [Deltaproteobacteria bacterium]|nr:DUF2267 domain-containing protein [Deltaproteobacteria bacterium]
MSMTGLSTFDRTVHEANDWLKDIMFELSWEDRQRAYQALRATLHALRDRLTIQEVKDLGAQLPMLIRGMYYEGWTGHATPEKIRHLDDFLARVRREIVNGEAEDIEAVTRAVFKMLRHRISKGEIEDLEGILPEPIRELWPHQPAAM